MFGFSSRARSMASACVGNTDVYKRQLLRYENDDEEAIFGWGHHSEDPGGRVFMTKSPRLIAVFDFFWRMLEKDSMSFMPDERRPIAPADITGLWFSTAYAPVQNWDCLLYTSNEVRIDGSKECVL